MVEAVSKAKEPIVNKKRSKQRRATKPEKHLQTWVQTLNLEMEEEKKLQEESEFRFCNHVHECGHDCDGINGESKCLPCLHPDCGPENAAEALKRDIQVVQHDLCGICFSSLGDSPCIQVCKRHIFHADCILGMLRAKWTTLSITFAFLDCPTCKTPMEIDPDMPIIGPEFQKWKQFQQKIMNMAKREAIDADLSSDRVNDPADPFYKNWAGLALSSCTFYECNKCHEPYFGGMIGCRQMMREERNIGQQDLRCGQCLSDELGFGQTTCDIHGDKFIDYKCRFCCNVALYVCFNGTHFCYSCHLKACR